MPSDFSTVITAVTAFVTDYAVYITAGLILGFGAWLVKRLVKSGR